MEKPLDKRADIRLENGNLPRETSAVIWEAGFAASVVWREHQKANGPMCETPAPPNPFRGSARIPHDYDDIAVGYMALAQMNRLAQKREEGRAGWDNPETSTASLMNALDRAAREQKWVDVANYATFLHARESKP